MNSAHQIHWSNQIQEARQRKRRLESNMKLAYTYIFSQFCDKELQSKIEHRSDFDQIEDNPIELLKAIDKLMHTISHEKLILPYETLWCTLAQLFEIKQGKDQKLSDYYETMKAFGNQVHKYFDYSFLDKFVMNLEDYNDAGDEVKKTRIKGGAWQRLLAYGVLHNADREKYGRLLKGYKSDYANNSDNYPTSMILMKERMSISYDESKNKKKSDKDKDKKSSVPEVVEFAKSFAQIAQGKKACWLCGGPHYADKCPLKDKIPHDK